MKAVIFAGGVGTRLWPLSRKDSPKQFEKVIDDKSTLQLAVDRLLPDFSQQDVYISTGKRYVATVAEQLPNIPKENIIGEPAMRDVGPAVGLMTAILAKISPKEPFIILWSDHVVKKEALFRSIIQVARKTARKHEDKIIFIAQKPRFASQNLGWIEFGESVERIDTINLYQFKKFQYRPSHAQAKAFCKQKKFSWNLGYFVTTPQFLWNQFRIYAPDVYAQLTDIQQSWGTAEFEATLDHIYPQMQKTHFDHVVLEKLTPQDAYVISEDIGWSDVGAWEALKEALQTNPDQNVVKGNVFSKDTKDSLIYNYTDQAVFAIDLDGHVVVNTKDVLLVCHKNSVPKIKKLVENLPGTENEHLV